MGRDKEGWSKDRDDALRQMVQQGMSARAIGNSLGLSHPQVIRRINKLGIERAPEEPVRAPKRAPHIQAYKRARRGFSVPSHLEPEYYELLKAGVPIAEACRRLGIEK